MITPPEKFKIRQYNEVDSTNTLALGLFHEGVADNTVIVARKQTMGRGRGKRRWESPEGNLYLSVLCTQPCERKKTFQYNFIATLAVAEALQPFLSNQDIHTKWPNDVLVNGKKISGVLPTARIGNDVSKVVIVGVGININKHPVREETLYPATSIAAEKNARIPLPEELLAHFLHAFDKWHVKWLNKGFAPIREAWSASMVHKNGDDIEIRNGNAVIRGTLRGINDNCALIIQQNLGNKEPVVVSVGDVLNINRLQNAARH